MLLIVGQASGGGGSSAGTPLDFIQYGVLGMVIIGLLLGWLWAKPAVDRLIADKERAEKQRDEMLMLYENKVMPALIESTSVLSALKPAVEQVARHLSQDVPHRERSSGDGP